MNQNLDSLDRTLKVGIAGYGIVGKRRRECIERHPNLKLVGVCDKSFDTAGVFDDGVEFFPNYRSLLEMKLDVLFVSVSNDMAAEVTIAGLQSGLHVFCEKPPGRNILELLEVISEEKKNLNNKLMYGFNHRFHDSVRDALKVIQAKELGEVINLRGIYGKSKLITYSQPDWRTKREIAGGGVLLDQGIHMVDLMRLFGGEFNDVMSFISNKHWRYNVEDNAYALMKTNDGTVGMLHSSATQWRHRFSLEITLENGSLILEGILSSSKSYGSETLRIVRVDHENDSGDPREQVTHYNHDPSWDKEVSVFTDSILNNRPILSGSSVDALNTMKLVYKIYYADPIWRGKFSIANPDEGS